MPSTKRSSSKTTNRSKSVGGRAASGGTRNETKYAATLAVQLLAGESMLDWRDASQIRSLTMQAGGDVDDVVIEACDGARMLVQAKGWSSKVSLTAKKGVLPDVFGDFAASFASAPMGDHRLLWVVAPEMGDGITSSLRKALELHRRYPAELPLADFEKNRLKTEKAGWDAARRFAAEALKPHLKRKASEDEARRFLRSIHVVVFDRSRDESDAVEVLRDKVIKVPSQAMAAWRFLSDEFLDINSDGLSHTLQSLRATLERGRFELKPLEQFAKDIESLRRISNGQFSELERHSCLPTDGRLRLERRDELNALRHASDEGSLVLVGAPGCGKSGLLHALALRLQTDGVPVITLLAENVRLGPGMESSAILGLEHGIDEVLCQWPSGSSGIFITDALDALRDDDLGRRMRQLLREVLKGNSGWRVVASVREFDLKAGTELQELFPGSGVSGYASPEFSKVKHFYLGGLRYDDLQMLLANVPGIQPFVKAVRASPQGHGMDRSLFHLRIAAELLEAGVPPKRLADLTTPNLLFDRYWQRMIELPKKGVVAREIMVRRICQAMVEESRPVAMRNSVVTSDQDVVTLAELRSAGIVSAPDSPSSFTSVGGIRFCHHLFQDYAIARTLLSDDSDVLMATLERHPLLPLFYTRSFVLALQLLWDNNSSREVYWKAALDLQCIPGLLGITRVAVASRAAQNIGEFADLAPLARCFPSFGVNQEALRYLLMHLSSGLADLDDTHVKNVADIWAEFASHLASAITQNPDVEAPLVHILARLNPIPASHEAKGWRNKAAIALLTLHLARPVNQGWTYAAMVSIECVCRTFAANPNESASTLLGLMSDERLRLTPKDDLHRIANNLKHILPGGGQVILRAFEAAFGHEVKHGEWENLGGAIMPLRMQSSDQWHSVQYSLAQFFEGSLHDFPGLAAEILAILAWSDSDGRKSHFRRTELDRAIGQIDIMGHSVTAIEDRSHYWQKDRYHAGNDIAGMMRSFRGSLVTWAETGNDNALQAAAAKLCSQRQPAYLTSNLFKAGAAAPATLGIRLLSALSSPCVFVHVDLYFEATNLLVALHGLDREDVRREVEDLILRLSDTGLSQLAGTEGARKIKGYLKSAENRILGSLDAAKITLPKLKRLHAKRESEHALHRNSPPLSFEFREAKPTAPSRPRTRKARELHELKEFCQELSGKAKEKAFAALDSGSWKRVVQGWSFLERHAPKKSSMAYEAWGALVGLCENIAGQVHQWQANDPRWKLVGEVLIAAAAEPLGDRRTEDDPNADLPSYGVPFPQVDAAQGLPWLAKRLGKVGGDVREALLKLSSSSNYPIRFNLMSSLQAIAEADGNLMWQILNDRLAKESVFHVIEASATVIELGLYRGETRAWIALAAAEKRAEGSKEDHSIRKRFAGIRLNYFVNQDHADCWSTISSLIQRCDEQASSSTLCGLIGWYREMLSVGQIGDLKDDQRRKRVWHFIHEATLVATQKLAALRKNLDESYAAGQQVSDEDQEHLGSLIHVIDQVASQIYFGSGAYAHSHPNNGKPEDRLDVPKTRRFLSDATPTLKLLCKEPHPHVAYEVVQSLDHFLSADPIPVFEMAASSILASCKAGFQHESLAVPVVVRLIERALADHREIFRLRHKTMPETLKQLIRVLDLFVEAGSKEARRLTHRLEQIQT